MIHIDRSDYDVSKAFTKAAEDVWQRLLQMRADERRSARLQKGLSKYWTRQFRVRAKDAANALFHGKCAYCETRVDKFDSVKVDHFRPKSKAVGLKGDIDTDGYWWLIAEWHNLYLSCQICSANKANHFPVLGRRGPKATPWAKLVEREKPLLIDPCLDDPSNHFSFGSDGIIKGKDERGNVTIELLDLNRPELVMSRKMAGNELQHVLKLAISDPDMNRNRLTNMLSDDSEYLATKRQFIRESNLGEILSSDLLQNEKVRLKSVSQVPSMLVPKPSATERRQVENYRESVSQLERIELCNFRAIEHIDLTFPSQSGPGEPWLVFIGENGMGKSSLLKALALLFASGRQRKRFVRDAGSCVTRTNRSRTGVIRAWFSHKPDKPVEISFKKGESLFTMNGRAPKTPLLAYGATRLPPTPKNKAPRDPSLVRIGNLFDPRESLSDVETYFASTDRIDPDTFNRLAAGLRKLLDLDDEDGLIYRRNGKIFIQSGAGPIELRDQSDGYQSLVGLAGDIMMNLSIGISDLESARGTVLVDEIGCHLHPQWRIRIVRTLREVFPGVRFIVTTHEPLCLRGTYSGEVYRLTRDFETRHVTASLLDVPPGLTADQLLTGSWFGLSSTLDEGTAQLMIEHSQLLSEGRKTSEQKKRQAWIESTLRDRLGSFNDTSLERFVRSETARFIKEHGNSIQNLSNEQRSSLRDRIRSRVGKNTEGEKR